MRIHQSTLFSCRNYIPLSFILSITYKLLFFKHVDLIIYFDVLNRTVRTL